MPAFEQTEFISRWNTKLTPAEPEEILSWAVATYGGKLTMGTALGASGCVILSMLSKIGANVDVFNLDTGYQFPETLDVIDKIRDKYGINIRRESAELSVEEYERINGGAVYKIDPDRCCQERKLDVLRRIAPNYDAWISGLRRDQGPSRANTPVVGRDAKFGLVKIAPLAYWTNKQVWDRIVSEKIPYNVLYDQGYRSIGCLPCTRQTLPGEDERGGRWAGSLKTECGLHS
ncbi:MAG: phosphoadenylyl-sulfate reductase, partial [Planctomycetaceae bacterium]|nr:phosphoadenylyl-sulfate reductase [Planctomycetaceae bacterium]